MGEPQRDGWDTTEIEDAPDVGTSSTFDDVDDMMSPPDPPDDIEIEDAPQKRDVSFLNPKARKPLAATYERQVKKTLGTITRELIQRPNTVADAATLIQYGPKFSRAVGDLAAESPPIAKFIGVAETVADNTVLAFLTSTTALVTQLVRNHEPVLEPAPRSFTFLRRSFKLPKIGIRLGLFRAGTHDPDTLIQSVLTDPEVIRALEKNGIRIVDNSPD